MKRLIRALLLVGMLSFQACAHKQLAPEDEKREIENLTSSACGLGAGLRSVKGSVWLKAQSQEASGQFPAQVSAVAPDKLQMEVTNLIGGTEAVISVDGRHYTIHVPSKKDAASRPDEQGYNSWGGIPLRWATDLFLGKVPCPSPDDLKDAKRGRTETGDLRIETLPGLEKEPELFEVHFRNWSGKSWPESIHWVRKSAVPLTVDFKFNDPDADGSPTKWEAKSDRGEVKVRWRDREMAR
jgi:hypothetical protein